MDEGFLGNSTPAGRKASKLIRGITVILILLIVFVCLTIVSGIIRMAGVNKMHEHFKNRHFMRPFPQSFLIPSDVRTPVKNQAHRGTCYIFSSMGLLEASYRRQGIANGWLKPDEYVSFSEQAYGIGLTRYCTSHKEDPHCLGGPPNNETADGQPEWLYYMYDGMHQYVLPTAVCPYQPEGSGQFECPGFDEAVEKNPLSYKVKGMRSAYSISDIKRLMLETNGPLSFSHVLVSGTYLAPCDDPNSLGYDSQQCKQCLHPCSLSSDKCCAQITVPGYTTDGVFGTYSTPFIVGGHAMIIVGWNDDMAVSPDITDAHPTVSVGGFIIKNSWDTTVGHSAEYWAMNHSTLEESMVCPCEGAYRSWIPVDSDCMLTKKDPVACGASKKYVINQWKIGGTVLKCQDRALTPDTAASLGWTGCQKDRVYVVAGDPSNSFLSPLTTRPESVLGLRKFKLIEYSSTDPSVTPKEVETNATTWYALERLLTPVNMTPNTDQCGYYFMPYDTFLKSNIVQPVSGTDTPVFSAFDIEWTKESYLANKPKGTKKDYSLLEKSTKKFTIRHFDGPLDFPKN